MAYKSTYKKEVESPKNEKLEKKRGTLAAKTTTKPMAKKAKKVTKK